MFRSANLALAVSLAGAIGVLILAGCSSDNSNPVNPGGGSTSSFTGMFASGTQSGKLTVTVNTTSPAGRGIMKRAGKVSVTASGTAVIGASTIPLTGTYDTSLHQIDLIGGGYVFSGDYDASTHGRASLSGAWQGPGGGSDTGEFICYLGNANTVRVYCGIYHSTVTPPDSGTFSFGLTDTILVGFSHAGGAGAGSGILFEGRTPSSGNPRAININYRVPATYVLFAPGQLDTTGADAVTGTYSFTDSLGGGAGNDAGTYAGTLCQ